MPQETLTLLLAAGWGGKEGSGGRPWVPPPEARDGLEAEKAPKERAAAILSKRSAGQESREQHQVETRAPSPVPGSSAPAPQPSPCCSPEPLPQPRAPPQCRPWPPDVAQLELAPAQRRLAASLLPALQPPAPRPKLGGTGMSWAVQFSTGWGSQGPRREPCFGEGLGAFGCVLCPQPPPAWHHSAAGHTPVGTSKLLVGHWEAGGAGEPRTAPPRR